MEMQEHIRETIEYAYQEYARDVEATTLAPNNKQTYLMRAYNFVRWLRGDFTPGAKAR